MGIPGYFAQAIKNVPNAIKTKVPNVTRLFLDFNSAVHRGVTENATEESVIQQACETLLEIVETVSPSESFFVAIDGVAPLAKVNQQRSRRYLSQKMKSFTNSKENNENKSKREHEIFDRNAITPGTDFMIKLCSRLKSESENIAASKGIKTIFSGSNVFGEGEHKIVEYIRRNRTDKDYEINCIYGLDADLIILSMVLVEQTGSAPYIIREKNGNIGEENKDLQNYEFLDVTALIENICSTGNETLSKKHKILNHVISSFLVGNDFLPPLSYLNIKHGGLENVLEMCKSPLCSETGYTINWDSICEVINDLANKEDDEFLKRDERYWATKPPITTDVNVIWDNYPVVNKNYKLKHISPGNPGWVPRYYESLFMIKDISSIVKSYVTGLQWTLDYYTGKYSKHTPCWQYVHAYAPTAIDVYNFIAGNPDTISGIVNEELQNLRIYEYDPDVALLMVTPPSSFGILNPKLRSFATDINFGIAHCFPEDFRINTYLKRWAHECKAIIPPVDLEKFRKIVT